MKERIGLRLININFLGVVWVKFRGIIFDLDGTLLDTIEDIADSVNFILIEYGLKPHTVDEYKIFVGEGIENLVKKAISKENEAILPLEEIVERVRIEYSKRWNKKTKPYEGIIDFLNFLEEKGIKKSIFSNKPDDFTKKTVEYYFPKFNFVSVYGARKDFPIKPDPFLAFKIIEEFGLKKEEVCYIGDSNTDIQLSKNAGLFSIGAAWGFRGKNELLEWHADYIANNLSELKGFF